MSCFPFPHVISPPAPALADLQYFALLIPIHCYAVTLCSALLPPCTTPCFSPLPSSPHESTSFLLEVWYLCYEAKYGFGAREWPPGRCFYCDFFFIYCVWIYLFAIVQYYFIWMHFYSLICSPLYIYWDIMYRYLVINYTFVGLWIYLKGNQNIHRHTIFVVLYLDNNWVCLLRNF